MSTRLNENKEDILKPIEDLFSNNDNTPINYMQFKYTLNNPQTKKSIYTHCKQFNTDVKSIINLVEEIRLMTIDKTIKSQLTKFSNLFF